LAHYVVSTDTINTFNKKD